MRHSRHQFAGNGPGPMVCVMSWRMAKKMLAAGALLIVLGAVVFMLQPGPPQGDCAPDDGSVTSGYLDTERGCALTVESFEDVMDHESEPKLFRAAGAIVVVAGLGVAGFGAVRARRSGSSPAA